MVTEILVPAAIITAVTITVGAVTKEVCAWAIPRTVKVARLTTKVAASSIKRNLDFIVAGMYFVAFLANLIGFWVFPATSRDKPVTHETVQMQIMLVASAGIWGGLSFSALIRSLLARTSRRELLADDG